MKPRPGQQRHKYNSTHINPIYPETTQWFESAIISLFQTRKKLNLLPVDLSAECPVTREVSLLPRGTERVPRATWDFPPKSSIFTSDGSSSESKLTTEMTGLGAREDDDLVGCATANDVVAMFELSLVVGARLKWQLVLYSSIPSYYTIK